jgi:DNA-binding PadR family transcriptional regulator
LRLSRYIDTIHLNDVSDSIKPATGLPVTEMLELAILGLLEGGEMHGYEIRRRLRDELGVFSNVSFGSLYPALSRLERAGAVEQAGDTGVQSRPSVPMTGSLGGERAALRSLRSGTPMGRRAKRVYKITESGRRQFADLLGAEVSGGDEARSFGLRLAFARYLPPQARLRLLERRRAQLTERLFATRAVSGRPGTLDRYARSLVEHTTEATEREISWLEDLIDLERQGATAAASHDIAAASQERNVAPRAERADI